MALQIEKWQEILNTLEPDNKLWLEQIKKKLIGMDEGFSTYQEWKQKLFCIDHEFDTEYNGSRRSLLHIAVIYRRLDVVKYLLEKKARVQANNGETPLHLAIGLCLRYVGRNIFTDYLNIVKYLAREKVGINLQANDGKTPLRFAIESFSPYRKNFVLEIIQTLLDSGADVNSQDKDGKTFLHFVIDIDLTKLLLQKTDIDVNSRDKDGRTPLHNAAGKSCAEIVEALINAGAKIDSLDKQDMTPLHLAAAKMGNVNIVRALVYREADVNARDRQGRTPLHYAAEKSYTKIVEALINAGAKIDSLDKQDMTPLHLAAAKMANVNIVRALVYREADVNARDRQGRTPLHYAAGKSYTKIVEALINAGAKIDSLDKQDMTPLHLAAAKMANVNIVRALVYREADVNARDRQGRTPLHYAAMYNHSGMIRFEAARRVDNFEIVNALLENGIDINVEDNDGKTPLQEAVKIEVAEPIVNQIAKLETIGSYVSEKNLQQRDEFINASRERQGNYSQHLQNCKKEVEKMEKENKPLHDFLRENDVNKMTNIWKENEGVRNKFNNESNLKAQYPEYAHILINKINKIKGIFLHNHKPLISILEKNYKCNFKTTTFYNINNFFEIHKNDIIVEMAAIEKSLIEFIDFKNFGKREVPRLDLYAFVQSIKNELADSKHSEASSSLLENSNAEAVVNQGQYYNLR